MRNNFASCTLHFAFPDVLVLGLGPVGIGILRSLKKCGGIRVFGVVLDPETEKGRFTRLCTVLHWANPKYREDEFIRTLIQWAENREKVIVFTTRDEEVHLLARYADILPFNILYYRNSSQMVRCLDDKVLANELAQSCGLTTPRSYPIKRKEAPDKFRFPGIIKPTAIPPKGFPDKNLLVEDTDALHSALDTYPCLINRSILQEYIPGGDDQVYQCTALIGKKGDMLGSIEIRKLRQYPVGRGIACFAHTLRHKELSDLCGILAKKSGITGLISVEFKKDMRDGQWVFIEANLRMPGYNSLFSCTDVNLSKMYISDLPGEHDNTQKAENSKQFYWMREELDLSNIVNKKVNIPISEWFKDVLRTDAFAFWHRTDPMPGMVNLFQMAKSFFNNLKRRFFSK